MRFPKKLPMLVGLFLLAAGLFLGVADLFHLRWYGIDIFSGAQYVTEDGQIADAPVESGEVTFWDYVPAWIYSLVLWLIAFAFFAWADFLRRSSRRIRRGTE